MKQAKPKIFHMWGIYDDDGRFHSWAFTREQARKWAEGRRVRKILITPVER